MKLDIYDTLREFHKNKLFEVFENREDLTDWEKQTLETLSGVLYLAEGVFCREELGI